MTTIMKETDIKNPFKDPLFIGLFMVGFGGWSLLSGIFIKFAIYSLSDPILKRPYIGAALLIISFIVPWYYMLSNIITSFINFYIKIDNSEHIEFNPIKWCHCLIYKKL